MDAVVDLLLLTASLGVLGFVAAVILKAKHSLLAYLGAGFLGNKVGELVGNRLDWKDPATWQIRSTDVHFLFGLVAALAILFVVRLVTSRSKGP